VKPTAKKSTNSSKAPSSKATKRTTATSKRAPATRAPAKTVKKATTTTKKAAPKKTATKRRSPYPEKWLGRQAEALQEERDTYLRQFESLRAEAESLVADYEPGDVQFDEESGEGDTLSIERERDLTLSHQARQMVEEIDAALAKIGDGTYGICEASGQPIPKERLEAIPWARVRVEYKAGGLASRH
jgi:DnaK suppressor protein